MAKKKGNNNNKNLGDKLSNVSGPSNSIQKTIDNLKDTLVMLERYPEENAIGIENTKKLIKFFESK